MLKQYFDNIVNTYQKNKLVTVMSTVLLLLCIIAMFEAPSQGAFGPSGLTVHVPSVMMIVLIGVAIGCYGTIVGIGGGPLIVPILYFFYGWENEFLVATSLMIVFLNAFSGSIGYAVQKRIDYRGGVKFSLAALPGAVLSGLVHHHFNIRMFNIIFGVFLLLLAVYCIIGIRKMREAQTTREIKDAPASHRRVSVIDHFGLKFNYASNDKLGVYMNLLLGFFVGFLGIGGGVFQVPILLFLLRYPPHIATATSHFITMLTCAIAVMPHLFFDNVYVGEALWMGLGVVVGAQAGAWLAPKLNSKLIMYLFVIVIFIFAVKLFI
ncbi:MAG: putative membrane protein YfcA [Candidatus Omnitrophota bacterium]|jgi:uncharacterized membrane protein YfcA